MSLRRLLAWFGRADVSSAWLKDRARWDMEHDTPELPRWRSSTGARADEAA